MHDNRSRKRQEAMARLLRRCRHTSKVWWSLEDIFDAINGPEWALPPARDRFYAEFVDALRAGTFDRNGKTRAALLHPGSPFAADKPWPQLRLTRERLPRLAAAGMVAVTPSRPSPVWHFVQQNACYILVEIHLVHDWLATWLPEHQFRGWLRHPPVADALCVANETEQWQGTSPAKLPTQPPPSLPDPVGASISSAPQAREVLVKAAIRWFRDEMVPYLLLRGWRPKWQEAYINLVQPRFPQLTQNAFHHQVWPEAAPAAWQSQGRRKNTEVPDYSDMPS